MLGEERKVKEPELLVGKQESETDEEF